MTTRSNQPDVRNPVLQLPAAQRLAQLPPETRQLVADLLSEISADARQRADSCWNRHKAPMAAYWKAVAVYSRHIRLAIRGTK